MNRIIMIFALMLSACSTNDNAVASAISAIEALPEEANVINDDPGDHLPGSCNNPVICNGPSTNPFDNPPSSGSGGGTSGTNRRAACYHGCWNSYITRFTSDECFRDELSMEEGDQCLGDQAEDYDECRDWCRSYPF